MHAGTYVYCQTRFIGFHRWPDAPKEVAYLQNKHRHEFHVKVTVKVKHDNRDVEFITLKEQVDEFFKPMNPSQMFLDYQSNSCEMIAKDLIQALANENYNVHSVEVSEDGENGAIVVCQ